MNKLLAGVGVIALLSMSPTPVNASLISLSDALGNCGGNCEGLTYTLEEEIPNPLDPLTAEFALLITGENSLTDTRGGRTGINAVAFNLFSKNPLSPNTGTMVGSLINGVLTAPDPIYQFLNGGLASGGCNLTGNFFCFDNLGIGNGGAPPQPSTLITGPVVLAFEVTLASGQLWSDYTTALKIDWVGSENNYNLVSKEIPINSNDCPDCVINPTAEVPEPSSIALMGTGIVGMLGMIGWKRRRTI